MQRQRRDFLFVNAACRHFATLAEAKTVGTVPVFDNVETFMDFVRSRRTCRHARLADPRLPQVTRSLATGLDVFVADNRGISSPTLR